MQVSQNDQENFALSPPTNRKSKVKESLVADSVVECGWDTERTTIKSSITYANHPIIIAFGETRKTADDQSIRKKVLTLETQLRNAETVIAEKDKKLDSLNREINQLLKDKDESDSLIQSLNE